MSCGCAVVATDNPGVLDYVEHERTAMVAPRRDPDALGDAVVRMLRDDDLRETLAAAGHEAIQYYTWQRAMDSMEALLSATVRGPRPQDLELGHPRR
jgi:glycosyltransferase involved in cell wall biosynthesis